MSSHITRLAPSPTGALHLGNVRTFVINWAMARRAGWRVALRLEDLDGPRVKPWAAEAVVATFEWLGMDWDGPALVQSRDLEPYREAMRRLAQQSLTYPSDLSRAEIAAAASAPQQGVGETRFPAEWRPALRPADFDDERTNWRFVIAPEPVAFVDQFAGPQVTRPAEEIGDFVIWTKRGQPAYQLAVVVDDARQGVTQVVRGDDLLPSAGRQILLIDALGLEPRPVYTHLPLVVGPDGRRLAKRHGDTRVDAYRDAGVPVERIIGLIAFWSGVLDRREPLSLREFVDRFDLNRLPPGPVTFTPEDDQWLRRER